MSFPDKNSSPVGILLAAGNSQRFGSNKLLHPVNQYASMLLASLDNISSVVDEVFVVVNPELSNYRSQLERPGVTVLINRKADQGMATSLVCGVSASEDAAGWIIALADMPYINPATFKLLLERFVSDRKIILPEYKEKKGHPVIFSSHFKTQLLKLNGDTGGREIIQQHQQCVETVNVEDEGVVKDIDFKHEII